MQTKQEKNPQSNVIVVTGWRFCITELWLDGNNLYVINYTQSIFHSVITSLYGYKDHFA